MNATKEELAAKLNGREYKNELTATEDNDAKRDGLVVVFGASDDLIEFRGAIFDETGVYDGGTVLVDGKGLLPDREIFMENAPSDADLEEYLSRKKVAREIDAIWYRDGYSWVYETDIPHATFDIVEGDAKYCRGIVFALADLAALRDGGKEGGEAA